MKTLLELGIDDERTVLIEVEHAPAEFERAREEGAVIGAITDRVAKQTIRTAANIGEHLAAICGSVVSKFADLPDTHRPDVVKLEFGVELEGSGDLKIVKGSANASMNIKAEWQRPQ